MRKKIIITAPSLSSENNVSGISSITSLIITNNNDYDYEHFNNFKNDNQMPGFFRNLEIAGSLLKWFRAIWPDKNMLVHYNYPFELKSILRDSPFILLSRILKRKLVIHVHGGKYLSSAPPDWLNIFLKMVFRKDQAVIVLSETEKMELAGRYGLRKIFVLPNCVDTRDSSDFAHRTLHHRALNLLYLGRIDDHKGLEDIYNALIVLDQKKIKYKFILAGKGPLQEYFVNRFAALLGRRFSFKGVISGKAKADLLKDCDVFLLPSLFEGLPMALLESMSFGVVPLVTDAGSMLTVVANRVNGLVVSKKAPQEIAMAVEMLAVDRDLLLMLGEKGKSTIEERFDIEGYISKLNEIYRLA